MTIVSAIVLLGPFSSRLRTNQPRLLLLLQLSLLSNNQDILGVGVFYCIILSFEDVTHPGTMW